MAQYLAVWYKSPEGMGPKIPATFTKELTDGGLIFTVTAQVDFGLMKENSLGIVCVEGDDVVGCLTWIDIGVRFNAEEGDALVLRPQEDE
jgi:hypothetical protein